jgi:hypothetical protein
MTHFPQSQSKRRAQRVQFGAPVPVLVKLDSGQRAKANLQSISMTGGVLQLPKALQEGGFVEVAFRMDSGSVQAMAEMLHPAQKARDGILQPFRFVALEDEDHRTLRMAVDSRVDMDFLGLRSSQFRPPKRD